MKDFEVGAILLARAESGDVDAMVDWATWRTVYNSDISLSDEEKTRVIRYYTEGMRKNNATAYLNMGAMYYSGEIVEQDYKKAVELYEKAVELGEAQAMCNLGYCYYYGRCVDRDYEKAYKLFSEAVFVDNNANAYYKLGDMYMKGLYVEKNEHMAYVLYTRAEANADDSDPNYMQADIFMRLGKCLLYGTGCKADALEALNKLSRAESIYYKRIALNIPNSEIPLRETKQLIDEAKSSLDSILKIDMDLM